MMKKNKTGVSENYLERKPSRPEGISWSVDEKGIVTLDIENTGVFNRIAQKILKNQKSHTFIWMRPEVLYGLY